LLPPQRAIVLSSWPANTIHRGDRGTDACSPRIRVPFTASVCTVVLDLGKHVIPYLVLQAATRCVEAYPRFFICEHTVHVDRKIQEASSRRTCSKTDRGGI